MFPEKEAGLIVDYVGVFRHLEAALTIYAAGPSGEDARDLIRDKAALVGVSGDPLKAGGVPVAASATDRYTITSVSRTAVEFIIVRDSDGRLIRTCRPAGQDGCGADSRW